MLPFYGRKLSRKTKSYNYCDLKEFDFFFDDSKFKDLKLIINNTALRINLEIGFGIGENLIFQSEKFTKEIFLACDPFISGVLKLKKKIELKKQKNIYFTNLDILKLFNLLKKIVLHKVYILFPDPWPKKRHKKRRIINKNFVKHLGQVTCNKSKVFIATDDEDYSNNILNTFTEEKFFKLELFRNDYMSFEDFNIFPTKYYVKAKNEKKKINFFIFSK